MKNIKRIVRLGLTAALTACLLTGCGGGSAQSSGTAAQSETQVSAVSDAAPVQESTAAATEASTREEAASIQEELPEKPGEFALPITDTPTTLTLWMRTEPFTIAYPEIDVTNSTFYQEMERRTGIHLDITGVIAFQADEQFNLMVAGGDYTDMIGRFKTFYTAGIDAGIENNVIIDLGELMDEYMPNY